MGSSFILGVEVGVEFYIRGRVLYYQPHLYKTRVQPWGRDRGWWDRVLVTAQPCIRTSSWPGFLKRSKNLFAPPPKLMEKITLYPHIPSQTHFLKKIQFLFFLYNVVFSEHVLFLTRDTCWHPPVFSKNIFVKIVFFWFCGALFIFWEKNFLEILPGHTLFQ